VFGQLEPGFKMYFKKLNTLLRGHMNSAFSSLIMQFLIYCITGIFGSHFNLADFICVAKLKSCHLILVQHGLVKVSYTTRKAY